MPDANPYDHWPIDRISRLTKAETVNLRDNARARGATDVVERCESLLAQLGRPRLAGPPSTAKGYTQPAPEQTVNEVAELIKALPPADAVPFAQLRSERIARPVSAFSELWREFIVCGFSSQEKSDPDTPLGNFARGTSPILDLALVLLHRSDQSWVANELSRAGLRRMATKKMALICSAREAFIAARGEDDRLASGYGNVSGLGVFVELAAGRASDRDLAQSAAFSASIDPGPLYGIGHKQIRNVLVNCGLAHNLVPLDSRWRGFFAGRVDFRSTDLAQRSRYLAIEDILRRALLRVQDRRSDIPNLAVLDSMVFAFQSDQGYGVNGWASS